MTKRKDALNAFLLYTMKRQEENLDERKTEMASDIGYVDSGSNRKCTLCTNSKVIFDSGRIGDRRNNRDCVGDKSVVGNADLSVCIDL